MRNDCLRMNYEAFFKNMYAGLYPKVKDIHLEALESKLVPLDRHELPEGTIVFVNGMHADFSTCLKYAEKISDYADGSNVHLLYNASQGFQADLLECLLNTFGIRTPPVDLFLRFVTEYHRKNPSRKIFVVCHSQGALIVRKALESLSQTIRDRLIIRSFGGASVIENELCSDSKNYYGQKDRLMRPFFRGGRADTEILATAYPGALEHEFAAPVYQQALREEVRAFVQKTG